MSGRKQNGVWLYFDKTKVIGKAICQAMYKKCCKEMQGLVARIKKYSKNRLKVLKYDLDYFKSWFFSNPDTHTHMCVCPSAPKRNANIPRSIANHLDEGSPSIWDVDGSLLHLLSLYWNMK